MENSNNSNSNNPLLECIPWIQKMIDTEKKHLQYLQENRDLHEEILGFISKSEKTIKHLEQRLIQYKNYLS